MRGGGASVRCFLVAKRAVVAVRAGPARRASRRAVFISAQVVRAEFCGVAGAVEVAVASSEMREAAIARAAALQNAAAGEGLRRNAHKARRRAVDTYHDVERRNAQKAKEPSASRALATAPLRLGPAARPPRRSRSLAHESNECIIEQFLVASLESGELDHVPLQHHQLRAVAGLEAERHRAWGCHAARRHDASTVRGRLLHTACTVLGILRVCARLLLGSVGVAAFLALRVRCGGSLRSLCVANLPNETVNIWKKEKRKNDVSPADSFARRAWPPRPSRGRCHRSSRAPCWPSRACARTLLSLLRARTH